MKVKFANGVVKECASPIEQRIYKSGIGVGWILSLKLIGETTSADIDSLITSENVSTLEFFNETEDGKTITLFTLSDYDKCSSSIIRHAEHTIATQADIQLTKGV